VLNVAELTHAGDTALEDAEKAFKAIDGAVTGK
jgi:hypothetical protein